MGSWYEQSDDGRVWGDSWWQLPNVPEVGK